MRSEINAALKHPQIYAYTTPAERARQWTGSRQGQGLIKIGYTERLNVLDRIWEQFPVKGADSEPFELIFKTSAIDEYGRCFNDHYVRSQLKKKGSHIIVTDGRETEWVECSKDELVTVINEIKAGTSLSAGRTKSFELRPEQQEAVNRTTEYLRTQVGKSDQPSHFLWNAKMRFGKTFTAYKLAQNMGWSRLIILTYKPATAVQWRADLDSHVDFEGWKFFGPREDYDPRGTEKVHALFASFQDILGKGRDGRARKARFKSVFHTDWDCVFIDEFHFGAWRDGARELYANDSDSDLHDESQEIRDSILSLSASNIVYLSGTPFRALANGEFTEDQIFNWTYSDEQAAKAEYGDLPGNPYADLPRMVLLTYQVPDLLKQVAVDTETNEFDLNEFFRAVTPTNEGLDGPAEPVFAHADDVNQWLGLLRVQLSEKIAATNLAEMDVSVWPYKSAELQAYLSHTIWFLPSVASCHAMASLLQRRGSFFSNYEVIVAAGAAAGQGEKALEPVLRKIGNSPLETRTITLTCGKLTTGVSVPPWTGILMLRNTTSPETYFQAAFRVQTPWSNRSIVDPDELVVIKPTCYVFDFAPTRALRLIADYSSQLSVRSSQSVTSRVEDFLRFLPVLCFDGSGMQELDASELLDVATVGTASSMLARRWQSDYLINVDSFTLERLLQYPELLEALKNLEGFRNLADLNRQLVRVINFEKTLNKVKKKRVREDGEADNKLTPEEKEEQKAIRKFRDELKRDLKKFITRIPIFMYLTDRREETLQEVIKSVEPDLFTKVTGLSIDDFTKLEELGLFNGAVMNQAVFAFKRFEEPSLSYAGGAKLSAVVGGYDTRVRRDDLPRILS
jgi:hypothetical protein